MKEFIRRLFAAVTDLRSVVGLCGILLSIAAHELFHIILHWGEIDSIHIFPGNDAIVEIFFTPKTTYNLAVEETIAYTITMITLLLTAMLIADIGDIRNEKQEQATVLAKDFNGCFEVGNEQRAFDHLSDLLGIKTVSP